MENHTLRYSLLPANILFKVCIAIVDQYGLDKAMTGRRISDFHEITVGMDDPFGISAYFKSGLRINLSTTEALSLAYLSLYSEHQYRDGQTEFMVGVDIEDRYKRGPDYEEYFCDGILSAFPKNQPPSFMPFQQVMAQNVKHSKKGTDIEAEIITQIQGKTLKRNHYNKVCGLLVSVLPGSGDVDIDKLCASCELAAFDLTYMMLYKDNLKCCTVFDLTGGICSSDDLMNRSLMIEPQV